MTGRQEIGVSTWRSVASALWRRGVSVAAKAAAIGVGVALGGAATVLAAFADAPAAPAADPFRQAPTVWVADSAGRLAAVDLGTGVVTPIAELPVVMTDLAFAPDGGLYGVSFDALFEIDPLTGSVRLIGRHAVPCGNALEIAPSGVAYAMGCSDTRLFRIDLRTGWTRAILQVGRASSGDLAALGDRLYLSARDGGADSLLEIDLSDGTVVDLGPLATGQVYGLAADAWGRLYGGAGRRYFRIAPDAPRAVDPDDVSGVYAGGWLGDAYGWAIDRGVPGLAAGPDRGGVSHHVGEGVGASITGRGGAPS